jgi:hypothetical protein
MNSRVWSLADDSNLRRRACENFRHAAIAANQASDTNGLAAVAHLGSSEGAAVLNPDHDREAPWARVVHAEVEKRRRAGAGRGKACAGNAAPDGCDAADGAPGVLPRDRAAASDGARRRGGLTLSSRGSAPSRYRAKDKEKSGDLPQVDPFSVGGDSVSSECVQLSRGQSRGRV